MKEFIDKLISRLEEEKNNFIESMIDGDYLRGNVNFAVVAKDIINQLAEEYKVSEMLIGWQQNIAERFERVE